MDYTATVKHAYSEYCERIQGLKPSSEQPFLQHNYAIEASELIYQMMVNEFTLELINECNHLSRSLLRLSVWEPILQSRNEEERIAIRYEFTWPLLMSALQLPYSFRNRLVFSSTKLSLHAGSAMGIIPNSKIPHDSRINYRTLESLSPLFPAITPLLDSLQNINDSTFLKSTRNFRHRKNHAISPHLDIGILNSIYRVPSAPGRTTITVGFEPPLSSKEAIQALAKQTPKMISGFLAYWDLVQEHVRILGQQAPAT
ncbi:hypothetical protein [Geothrix paludis]|uniref:hypothetical protein n=1 Tax=Geothrix paludis TaxID=2922722 RepID=UPI001FAB4BF3|nr:hypothetical protein [Geothrix paludis]